MAKKIAKKAPKKATAKEETKVVEPVTEQPKSTGDKVGAYLVVDKLIKIEWEKETEKTVKATGGNYHDSNLKKERVLHFKQHLVDDYNGITHKIQDLVAQQKKIIEKLGNKF